MKTYRKRYYKKGIRRKKNRKDSELVENRYVPRRSREKWTKDKELNLIGIEGLRRIVEMHN